ncbi:MAG: hypothetical protein K2X69_12955 [Silvanigrellaceae bacterium]|nr:hypothetical protein [Silvanigrellaceae bacterium]
MDKSSKHLVAFRMDKSILEYIDKAKGMNEDRTSFVKKIIQERKDLESSIQKTIERFLTKENLNTEVENLIRNYFIEFSSNVLPLLNSVSENFQKSLSTIKKFDSEVASIKEDIRAIRKEIESFEVE